MNNQSGTIEALEKMIQLAEEYVKDSGGCDHSVGDCWCQPIRDIAFAKAVLVELIEEEQAAPDLEALD